MDVVLSLVTMVYRSNKDLCERYWSVWYAAVEYGEDVESRRAHYPLCQLLDLLVHASPHEPRFLLTLLHALCSTPKAAFAQLELLNQSVYIVSKAQLCELKFLAHTPPSQGIVYIVIYT